MPKRTDLSTILIIGSGPIVIGQGCEFDYSGTQACKALREEGFRVVLVNSNPATIMTDPQMADRTYIEPITPEAVERIIVKEAELGTPIDALLPTLGGQTALNCACALDEAGTLAKHGIEMIGANRDVIYKAEDRMQFKEVVESVGLQSPKSGVATTYEEALDIVKDTGLPAIVRPAFTLGGTGGGIAYNLEEFEDIVRRGLDASMNSQVLIDQSLLGWKEYEFEVMRDKDDNCVIVCAIENLDPMGVHTGDSITVAPAQTLTDKEYQRLRDGSLAVMRAIGVDTGGSNVQFAVNPDNGDVVVIEMNPRVSRSSALASKATGFPIAKIAAKLAVGYTLWELPNDITGQTVACFEPSIDYVVTKLPRWTFEKFPEADETLTTQMKSVGEAMSIGRTFKESLQKGIRSMEVKRFGLGLDHEDRWLRGTRDPQAVIPREEGDERVWPIDEAKMSRKLSVPSQGRLHYLRYAFKAGWSIDKVFELTKIDRWFLDQVRQLATFEDRLMAHEAIEDVPRDVLFQAKQMGFSDGQLACVYHGTINAETILKVRSHLRGLGIAPVYKLVDTCAAEFEAATPYYYSTYEAPVRAIGAASAASRGVSPRGSADGEDDTATQPGLTEPGSLADDEVRITDKKKVVILGGGPNRVGQGIEFDYCCVQAAFAAEELGFESVMINSNPETVSTDYDTSDLLFFEPLTLEDVLNVVERLNGKPFGEPVRVAPVNDPAGTHDRGVGLTETGSGGHVHGVIVQFGGQTPLNLAKGLEAAGVPIIGTPVASIDLAEDRDQFAELCREVGVNQPENGIAHNVDEAVAIANRIGYPVLVRPSFVLGGRAMETVFDDAQLRKYMAIAIGASDLADQPILIDKFLFKATECDVDVVADFVGEPGQVAPENASDGEPGRAATGSRAIVCGVLEHIEEAGIHSGDSACAIPPYSLRADVVESIKAKSRAMAERLQVNGLMNVQWAVRAHPETSEPEVFVIEVNPRASRTVPFVGKATGVPWAKAAAKVMMGQSLAEQGITDEVRPARVAVKESVFPFSKFPGVDVILGPEMRSTGEVMGSDPDFAIAFAKAQMAASQALPTQGKVFLSVRADDKPSVLDIGRDLVELGFEVCCTGGTHDFLAERGVKTTRLMKISEGRPNAVDLIKNGELALVLNTPTRKGGGTDEGKLRATAVRFGVPMITTLTGASAAVRAMRALREERWRVWAIQDAAEPVGV
jgi:carbamoyl-phosphate synthase large subunit